MTTLIMGENVRIPFQINATDLAAGTAQQFVSPVDGFVVGIEAIAQVVIAGAASLTVDVGTTPVAGLAAAFADTDPVGTIHSGLPTAGDATQVVAKGGRIQVIPGAAFTGGAVNGFITINTGKGYNG